MVQKNKSRDTRIRMAYDLGYESGFAAGFEENEYRYLDGCMDSLITILNSFFEDEESEGYKLISQEIADISKRKRELKLKMNSNFESKMESSKQKDSNKFYELV